VPQIEVAGDNATAFVFRHRCRSAADETWRFWTSTSPGHASPVADQLVPVWPENRYRLSSPVEANVELEFAPTDFIR
jgi:hypothetical protein